jgi:hypothetical protein
MVMAVALAATRGQTIAVAPFKKPWHDSIAPTHDAQRVAMHCSYGRARLVCVEIVARKAAHGR